MSPDPSERPLSADLEVLDRLLLEAEDEETMLLPELEGYLAGVIVSPHPVPQEQWLREIWCGQEHCFPDDPDRSSEVRRLVLARHAEIIGQLLQGDLAYAPVYDIDRDDTPLWEIWVEGFSRAMGLSGKDWDVLLETGDEDLGAAALGLIRYVVLVKAPDVDAGLANDGAPPEDVIPYLVETLYRRQKGLDRVVLDPLLPLRPRTASGAKVGRNDPCPCGSGRKYKKCCGAG